MKDKKSTWQSEGNWCGWPKRPNHGEGFIKEFKMLKFNNKDFIDFYIDFDTAGENAFDGFVKLLNDSDFEIRKLEFDGK